MLARDGNSTHGNAKGKKLGKEGLRQNVSTWLEEKPTKEIKKLPQSSGQVVRMGAEDKRYVRQPPGERA